MGKKSIKIFYTVAAVSLLVLLSTTAVSEQQKMQGKGADTAAVLKGKTVWVVDVNTNEYYTSFFQLALVKLLPGEAPGVIVRHVTTAEKGNPFFLVKQENCPDAVIVSLAVCDATSKNVANYASSARKKGIPTVVVYNAEVLDLLTKWNNAYRNPPETAIKIDKVPQSLEEAEPIAKQIIPILIGKLENQTTK